MKYHVIGGGSGRVCSYPGATVEDVSGHASVEMRSKHRKQPDIAILHAGSNNLGKGETIHSITDDLTLAITQLRNNGVKNIALSGVTPRAGHEVDGLNKRIKEVCKDFRIGFIDNSNILYQNHVSKDCLHLNSKGVDILQNNFIRWVKSVQLEKE